MVDPRTWAAPSTRWALVFLCLAACSKTSADASAASSSSPASTPDAVGTTSAPSLEAAKAPATAAASTSGSTKPAAGASIGQATMEPDGTIVLQLRAEGPSGIHGDALLRYPKDHPEYQSVLKHLGGLKPGENKSVPPWPD